MKAEHEGAITEVSPLPPAESSPTFGWSQKPEVMTGNEGLSDAIEAYKHFGRREAG
jgi:hypothetical protein